MSMVDSLLPPADANGFIPTLNRMGGMTPVLDAFGEAFVAAAANARRPVLDIGAAYGLATIAALAAGATVVANDLDPRHLELLRARTPEVNRSRLTLLPGAFPEELILPTAGFEAVLLARVLHFLDGAAIGRGLADVHRALVPGGRVFGVTVTPFLKKLQPFRPTYEARKAAGDPWPGLVEDVGSFDPEGAAGLPGWMHFLDPEVLTRALETAGFEIERMELGSRQAFVGDMRLDGREMLGFIARKPG